MATTPQDGRIEVADERATARERSVGEHIFIWIAWALAAAFWGMTLTTVVEIFRSAAQSTPQIAVPGAPGGSAFLVLVVVAFLVMAFALAYAEIRAAGAHSTGRGEAATSALYNSIEAQGGEDLTTHGANRRGQDEEFH